MDTFFFFFCIGDLGLVNFFNEDLIVKSLCFVAVDVAIRHAFYAGFYFLLFRRKVLVQ